MAGGATQAESAARRLDLSGALWKCFPNKRPTLYAAVAYWDLAPGGEEPYSPVPPSERLGYCVEPELPRVKGALNMGVRHLAKGQHRLRLEIVGANEKAIQAYMAGLDSVKLEPVK